MGNYSPSGKPLLVVSEYEPPPPPQPKKPMPLLVKYLVFVGLIMVGGLLSTSGIQVLDDENQCLVDSFLCGQSLSPN